MCVCVRERERERSRVGASSSLRSHYVWLLRVVLLAWDPDLIDILLHVSLVDCSDHILGRGGGFGIALEVIWSCSSSLLLLLFSQSAAFRQTDPCCFVRINHEGHHMITGQVCIVCVKFVSEGRKEGRRIIIIDSRRVLRAAAIMTKGKKLINDPNGKHALYRKNKHLLHKRATAIVHSIRRYLIPRPECSFITEMRGYSHPGFSAVDNSTGLWKERGFRKHQNSQLHCRHRNAHLSPLLPPFSSLSLRCCFTVSIRETVTMRN